MYSQPKDSFAIAMDIRSKIKKTLTPQEILAIKIGSENETLKIFFSQFGLPTGYIVWANLCRESLHRFGRINRIPQNFYEWNEGHITTIFDVTFIGGLTQNNQRLLKQFVKSRRLFAFKRRANIKLYKNIGKPLLLSTINKCTNTK